MRTKAALLLVAALASAGCLATLTGAAEPRPAPAFRVVDTQGGEHDLASYNGSVLVLDLMATWCVPCVAEMEHLRTIRAAYAPSDLQILSIATDTTETPQEVDAFAKEHGAQWPFALDYDGVAQKYGLRILPKLVIVSPDGQIVFENQGETSSSAIARAVGPYVGER